VIRFVLDASALLEIVIGRSPSADLRRSTMTAHGAAPELIDLEAISTVRRLVRSGSLPLPEAAAAARDIGAAPLSRTAHRPLLTRVWALRDSITAYDAAYIALAERLDVPLLTCDARLGRVHGHDAEVIVYPTS
jgi:predicted nucleic acid-binding protein